VHAERGAARGADALYEIAAWEAVEFAYDYSVRAPVQTIHTAWHEAVIAAVSRRRQAVVGRTESVSEPPAATPEPKAALRRFFGKAGLVALASQTAAQLASIYSS
jgi:hypothetical protein